MSIVRQLGLREDDELDRIIKAEGGKLIIHIKPIKTDDF